MIDTNIRKPAVTGRFYPKDKKELSATIEEIYLREKSNIEKKVVEGEIIGAVVPHAGYMYSAYQAVHFFSLLRNCKEKTDTFIIINPNHTGYGDSIDLDSHRFWSTPFGNVEQDAELQNLLECPFVDTAHSNEHSGEVMLPLLQYFIDYNFKVVFITLSRQNAENAKILAERINSAKKRLNRKIIVIASSDFTHFKDVKTSEKLDNMVLEAIEKQKTDLVEKTVREKDISVCGFGTIMSLMEFAKLQGNFKTEIIARGHSGQIMPSEKVVNYITILFTQAN